MANANAMEAMKNLEAVHTMEDELERLKYKLTSLEVHLKATSVPLLNFKCFQ